MKKCRYCHRQQCIGHRKMRRGGGQRTSASPKSRHQLEEILHFARLHIPSIRRGVVSLHRQHYFNLFYRGEDNATSRKAWTSLLTYVRRQKLALKMGENEIRNDLHWWLASGVLRTNMRIDAADFLHLTERSTRRKVNAGIRLDRRIERNRGGLRGQEQHSTH